MQDILISHESPLCLLDNSLLYNSYDYALAHLAVKIPEYYSFFERSLLSGREVLLDCSTFELKAAFDVVKYAKLVDKLKPTFYIVPDALEDVVTTVSQYESWLDEYSDLPGLRIGVVQGKNYRELCECYKYMSDNADYIAISFDYSYYTVISNKESQLAQWADGRIRFIKQLIEDGIWNWNKPCHLLGNSLVSEHKWLKRNNIYNVRSIDTSAPIMYGIAGYRYIKNIGNTFKPKGLLADNINIVLTPDQIDDIWFNIKEFRNIVNN